jgi:hypothetical protein
MNITLGYARTVLANFADSGYCPEDDRVRDCINNAVQRLMTEAPADASTCRMRFCVTNGCITLPREVEQLIKFNACAYPVTIQNRWYEFLEGGPGSLEFSSSGALIPVDMGDGFRVHTDIIIPRQILATCDVNEDVDGDVSTILIRGNDENGKEVIVDGELGESIELDNVVPKYSTKKFSTITSVVKPQTNGYVYLSAYDPDDTTSRYDIATYHPYEELPSYRRYFITGGSTSTTTVIALARLRWLPALDDSDTLLVQNIPALQGMMQAMNQYNAGEIQKGQQFEAMAIRYYLKQIERKNMGTMHIDFAPGFAPGDVEGVM